MRLLELAVHDGSDSIVLPEGITVLHGTPGAPHLAQIGMLLRLALQPDGARRRGGARVAGLVTVDDDLDRLWQVGVLADGRLMARMVRGDGSTTGWSQLTGPSIGAQAPAAGPVGTAQLCRLAALPQLVDDLPDDVVAAMAVRDAAVAAAAAALAAIPEADIENLSELDVDAHVRESLILEAARLTVAHAEERRVTAVARTAQATHEAELARLDTARTTLRMLERPTEEAPRADAAPPTVEPTVEPAVERMPGTPELVVIGPLLPRWFGWLLFGCGLGLAALALLSDANGVPRWSLPLVAVVVAIAAGYLAGRALGIRATEPPAETAETAETVASVEPSAPVATTAPMFRAAPVEATPPDVDVLAIAAARENVAMLEHAVDVAEEPVRAAVEGVTSVSAARVLAGERWITACTAAGVDPTLAPDAALEEHQRIVVAVQAQRAVEEAEDAVVALRAEHEAALHRTAQRPLVVDALLAGTVIDTDSVLAAIGQIARLAASRQLVVLTDDDGFVQTITASLGDVTSIRVGASSPATGVAPDDGDPTQLQLDA